MHILSTQHMLMAKLEFEQQWDHAFEKIETVETPGVGCSVRGMEYAIAFVYTPD